MPDRTADPDRQPPNPVSDLTFFPLTERLEPMKRFILFLGVLPLLFTACEEVNPNFQADAADPEYLHRSVKQLTDVIVHDICRCIRRWIT